MGGMTRLQGTISVNDKHELPFYDNLHYYFVHNWAGDDWYMRIIFKKRNNKGEVINEWHSHRIYYRYNYSRFSHYQRFITKLVRKYVISEKKLGITLLKQEINEHFKIKVKFNKDNIKVKTNG